ncbi:hypothetical protein [Sideroxydans lithotrophicus]|uniref:Cytochrome c1 protein n=1 Tax=Sideroxydans lithotrophicus (strain ES-1) TaxID=580332 RepID=D5CLB7_SIDLE|nr:hypothetical protein [Sideroxydans lithotrophicus]ADE10505.1 conserved hypothetical protein [Sideroxydans lithotrophicus ES-1]
MKKIVLSLAGVLAATAFAPEASALPLFARQTGMACSACHFQHFPMLNSFGRAFKAAGFTMVGAQGKIEGDNLSIPDTLNAAVLTTMGYVKTNNNGANAAGVTAQTANSTLNTPQDGTIYVPGTNGEFSLFLGGRTSDFSGALAEVGLTQSGGIGAGLASAKFPFMVPVGDMHIGIVPFTTDGQGASYGFEYLNTGANAVHTMLFAGGDVNGSIGTTVSAQQYLGTATAATGAALVANSDLGFINITKFHGVGTNNLGFANGGKLGSTYIRVAGTFDVAGWDSAVGVQSWSGVSSDVTALLAQETKATAIDGQMQGTVGEMPLGVYASYATAPVASTGMTNLYNANVAAGATARKAIVVAAELGFMPEVATVGVAYRRGTTGAGNGVDGDNSILLSASYKIQQNLLSQIVYTKQSGSAWNGIVDGGDKQLAINLAVLW